MLEYAKRICAIKEKMLDEFMETNPNVMQIILEIYRHQIEELSQVNPLLYSELHKYGNAFNCFKEHKQKNIAKALDFFNKGIEEGFFRSDVKYEILLELADVQENYIMSTKFYLKYPFIDIYKNVLLVSVRGFATEKGVAILEDFLKTLGK